MKLQRSAMAALCVLVLAIGAPQLASSSFAVQTALSANRPGHTLKISFADAGKPVAEQTVRADLDLGPTATVTLPEDQVRTWSPEDPHLYDLTVQLLD